MKDGPKKRNKEGRKEEEKERKPTQKEKKERKTNKSADTCSDLAVAGLSSDDFWGHVLNGTTE